MFLCFRNMENEVTPAPPLPIVPFQHLNPHFLMAVLSFLGFLG